jgi:hypothetical protein
LDNIRQKLNQLAKSTDEYSVKEKIAAAEKLLDDKLNSLLSPTERKVRETLNRNYAEINTAPANLFNKIALPDTTRKNLMPEDITKIGNIKKELYKYTDDIAGHNKSTQIDALDATLNKLIGTSKEAEDKLATQLGKRAAKSTEEKMSESLNKWRTDVTELARQRDLSQALKGESSLGGGGIQQKALGMLSGTAIVNQAGRLFGKGQKLVMDDLNLQGLIDKAGKNAKGEDTLLATTLKKMYGQPKSVRNALLFSIQQQPGLRDAFTGIIPITDDED